MEDVLYDTLCKCRQGDKSATLALVRRFDPLLHKYGRKLETEDGYNDMLLEFLCLLRSLDPGIFVRTDDGTMVSYIAKSVYHSYTKLLREKIRTTPPTVCIDLVPESAFSDGLNIITEPSLPFELPQSLLTPKERQVVYLTDIRGYTLSEVARMQNTTRQNTSQTRKRALAKIKAYLEDTDQL